MPLGANTTCSASFGFVRGPDGSIATLTAPGDIGGGTYVTALNDSGQAAGSYSDSGWSEPGLHRYAKSAVPSPARLSCLRAAFWRASPSIAAAPVERLSSGENEIIHERPRVRDLSWSHGRIAGADDEPFVLDLDDVVTLHHVPGVVLFAANELAGQTSSGETDDARPQPFTGASRSDIDATTLDGKVLCG